MLWIWMPICSNSSHYILQVNVRLHRFNLVAKHYQWLNIENNVKTWSVNNNQNSIIIINHSIKPHRYQRKYNNMLVHTLHILKYTASTPQCTNNIQVLKIRIMEDHIKEMNWKCQQHITLRCITVYWISIHYNILHIDINKRQPLHTMYYEIHLTGDRFK